MNLSFFSRLVPSRKKRNLFLGICLTESSGICYAFEQTSGNVELVRELPFEYADGFGALLDDVDKAVYSIEKDLGYNFKRALFVVPSLALGVQQKEISAPYRGVIADIMHNLEFEAMGYIEMIDCYKGLIEESHSSAYVEMGKEDTLLIFNRRANHWKTIVVKTHLANILNHLDEFLTKGTTLYVRILHKSIQSEQIIPAIHQYSVTVCTDQALHIGLLQLLRTQLLIPTTSSDTSVLVPQSTEMHEQVVSEETAVTQTSETPSGGFPEDESLIVDTQPIIIPPEEEIVSPYSSQTPDAETNRQDKDEVEGFKIFKDDGDKTAYVQSPSTYMSPTGEYSDIAPIQHAESQSETVEEEMAQQAVLEESTTDNTADGESEQEEESETPSIHQPARALQSLRSLGAGLVIALSAVALSLVAVELFIHKVTIRVYVPTEIESVSAELTGIPLSKIVEEKDISVGVPATGEKEVGDRAKGKVILASFDDKEASFSAGTRLVVDDEPYQLDEDVVLPPAAVDTGSGTKTASKKSVNASASFIGLEGNVEKNKQFIVDDYPTTLYYAIAETSFSGGTRRTVSVVSKEDVAELKSLITKKAKEASESVRSNTGEGVVVLDDISSVDLTEIQYSADQGEIASRIDAEGSVKADLYTIEKDAVTNYLTAHLKEQKGDEYQFVDNGSTYGFSNIELSEDESSVAFTLDSQVRLFKKVDPNRVKSLVRLKSLSGARKNLTEGLNIQNVEFDFSPVLPLFQSFMPYRTDYIGVEIKPASE